MHINSGITVKAVSLHNYPGGTQEPKTVRAASLLIVRNGKRYCTVIVSCLLSLLASRPIDNRLPPGNGNIYHGEVEQLIARYSQSVSSK
jgi:hypothetical protein